MKFAVFLLLLTQIINVYCRHKNNWAVLVDTSRFWFNYRHVGNVIAMYRSVKRLGIPDSRIILMIADDAACNARNPRPGAIYHSAYNPVNLYGEEIEIDYRGNEVTVENFIRVLTGRLPPSTPNSRRLNTDQYSNVLIYMTGHGGEKFLKFQDENEISSIELADAIEQMWQKRRYNEILLIADTCQAESMGSDIYSPNVLFIGSSKTGEDSLSHHLDSDIGVYVADRYSHYAMEFLDKIRPDSQTKITPYLRMCPYDLCLSTVTWRTDLASRDLKTIRVIDFFGSWRQVEAIESLTNFAWPANYTASRNTCDEPSWRLPLENKEGKQFVDPFIMDS